MTGDATDRRTDLRASAESRSRAARLTLGFGSSLAVAAVATVAFGPPPLVYQYVPLALSVLVLGLPHGAVDHLVLPRARDNPVTPRSLASIGALYLLFGSAYALVWVLAPVAAFVLFLLVTLVHWGQGDVYVLLEFLGADYLETRASRLLALLVRGGLPMLVPLVAFPAQYAFVAETIVGLFDPGAATALEPLFEPPVRAAVAVGFGSLIALSLALGLGRTSPGGRRPWLVDAAETIGLVGFFATVPPILAIGLYFCVWHSLRHVLRTMLVDPVASAALERGATRTAFRRFARDAAPLTVAALGVLVGIWFAVPRTPATVPDVLAVYLVAIAVLTLPHVVVVALLDREAGIWSP
ncbi:Beta-carotene 15,15'-monooxygenase, Brp/Blh family protein [Natrinema pellirubrum DSM 15624]|uniref:Probable beta-carotene 15,15'-dioxygenase n=1 Tax=Natrinema pellirubrum (strain DSM 15624 / CIP 106293 / JCM 10476 / NCIMB 786 / 157) TaxID=797303 RepID=L0JIX2_NATP1|nr:Brp/Blh family beta-carotene 15,15'-dioxygenase [Natrinema pellirubrum]AGB30276.1 beta-carotene 15,15''-monooxygenase, Brp/Blh family [Natrinema pellirubrum DSM 15624]ELY79051.1 Beta-carotene 15,15'-monooxygenase, Brp/Blh family protein [Natrinema pellirubrum DSM 15624]